MKKLYLATLISLLLALLASSALAQNEAQDEIDALCDASPLTIEFWHGFTGGDLRATLENLTLEFNRQHEGEACVRTVGQGDYQDLSTKILAASAAGELPVLAMGYENNIAAYLEAGVVADLGAIGVETEHIYPNLLEAVTWDGSLYGVPFNKSVHIMYFNRDLLLKHADALAAAGIEENENGVRVPTTVEGFIAAGTALKEVTGDPVYFFNPNDVATYEDWFFSLGGDYFDAEGNLVLNSETGVEALQLLVDLVHKYEIARPITDGYINESFGLGTFGFAFDTSAGYTYYVSNADFDVGLAPLPGRDGEPGASVFQGTNLLVFNQAGEAEQQLAADYINFLTQPNVNAIFAAATGYVPLGEAAANEESFVAYLEQNPDFNAIIKQVPYARFEPNLADWQQIRFEILGQAITKAVLQEATPQEALDEAQAAAEALLAGETR